MLITRTPLRVSFVGGGTDIADFYRNHTGAVVSTAINKYMYIIVNKRYDDTIRVSYSKTEIVNGVDEIEHPLVREALKLAGIKCGIEIVSIADIPSGTGLGSSSSFAVGLLNALYAYTGSLKSPEELAKMACYLEIDVLGEPIGKQDQYIAAYGGFKYIRFNSDDSVDVEPIFYNSKYELNRGMMLFRINGKRNGRAILFEQKANMKVKTDELRVMSKLANDLRIALENNCSPDIVGHHLHTNWDMKQRLAAGISNDYINEYYDKALTAGARGGKICGEGGNGYLLIYCPQDSKLEVRAALYDLECTEFEFEREGSRIVYVC